jgi:hypothetical protein
LEPVPAVANLSMKRRTIPSGPIRAGFIEIVCEAQGNGSATFTPSRAHFSEGGADCYLKPNLTSETDI